MMTPHRRVLLSVLFALATTTRSAGDDVQAAWSVPRFAPDADALSNAASAAGATASADVLVLDDEENYVFDADGKSTHIRYLAYKVLTQKGADGWDSTSLEWEPWHEDRPTIRARVLTPDGTIYPLDPKTISDSPARDDDDQVYGDSRVLRAPLPAIAPGSIVEEEDFSKENAPFFGGGVVVRSYFGRNIPVQFSKLTIDSPASLPMRYTAQLLPDLKPNRTESGGRVQLEFTAGPMDALEKIDNYLPTEAPGSPQVIFATGRSWQSVAEGYSKIVDEKATVQDVQPIVKSLLAGKSTREEKAAAIIQYLSREIRYTGIEFGDAAIIPHSPAETLKRKYGDCKDKATLAVTMLRAAGVPAYVALLNVGARQDVEKDLPGMGLFDHAIVYVPGDPELWLDITSEYSRLGQVPADDQGRLALVARNETTALVRIPEASSQDNRVVEKRDFFLAETGPARVLETSEPHGVFESQYRSAYVDGADKETKKKFKEYLESQYLADKVGATEISNSGDLSGQFHLVLEAATARRGFTDIDSAVAAIRLESLFYWLPDELQRTEKPAAKGDCKDTAKEKPKKPRTADYLLPEAFVCEWQYRISPPVGFLAKPLPPNTKISLGPALLTEEFSAENDGTIRALLRFDTTKRRYSVSEATELRASVEKLRGAQAIAIYFEPKTQALLNQGKTREAFQASRELIALNPKEAIHHLQRAKALLAAGMGQAAREEAREAVRIEPTSALAQKTLANILEYDAVGRRYRRGSDYTGAEAAFRAAKKLDPDDNEVVGNLAILLEYNHDGERYGPGAPLKQAVAEYRSLKDEDLVKIGLQNNLPFALFYAGDFAGAKRSAEALNPQISAVVVASQAALSGFDQGMAEARKRSSNEEELKTVCKAAGEMLMRARNYPRAADLEEAGAAGSNASSTMALAAMLRKAKVNQPNAADNTPNGLVTRMFLDLMDPQLSIEKFSAIYSRNARKVITLSDVEELETTLKTGRVLRNSLSRIGFPADVMMDVVLVAMQMQTEGDDLSGYRITITPPGAQKLILFVVKEDGVLRILDSAEKPNAIGLEVLDRLAVNNTAGARILLDWVRDAEHLAGGDDPLAGFAFPRMWTKGKEASAEQMKVAAAAILAQSPQTALDGIPILEANRATAASDPEKLNLAIALLSGYSSVDEYAKDLALASEVAKQYPESKSVFFSQQIALRGLGRFAEADQLAQEMTKRLPDDTDVMRAFIYTAVAHEDYSLAHELGRKMVTAGEAEAQDLNAVAWNALFTGFVQNEDLEDATKSAQLTQNSAGVLHTLGCVYAEMGKTKEAREVLIQAMDQMSLDEPDANYAFGRIAEQYGEYEIATSDYKQIKMPNKPVSVPGSAYRLAQNRLSAMRGADHAKAQ